LAKIEALKSPEKHHTKVDREQSRMEMRKRMMLP